jgi:hypothetical protein
LSSIIEKCTAASKPTVSHFLSSTSSTTIALKPCGLFTEAIRNYLRNYPSPDFGSFSMAMSAEADLCGPNTTVATAGDGTGLVAANHLPSFSQLHFKSMEELTNLITSTVTQVLEQRQRDETKRRRQRKQRDKQKTAAWGIGGW